MDEAAGKKETFHTSSKATDASATKSDKTITGIIETSHDKRLQAITASDMYQLSTVIRKRFGNGPLDPEDVAQEAFRRLLERGNTSAIDNIKGFLWRTACNLVLDALKSTKSRAKYDAEITQLFSSFKSDSMSPENTVLIKQQLVLINSMLRKMPVKQRRAVILYRVDGLSQSEIARRLKLSRSMITKLIADAHAELSALFLDDSEG